MGSIITGTVKVTAEKATLATGKTMTISGGTVIINGGITGGGTLKISGTATVTAGAVTADVNVSGGNVTTGNVTGNVTASGSANVTTGDVAGNVTASGSASVTAGDVTGTLANTGSGTVAAESAGSTSGSVTIGKTEMPYVVVAPLHDTRTEGAVADQELVDTYTVNVTAGQPVDGVDAVYDVTLTATDLVNHQNGGDPESMGYWLGIRVEGTTDDHYTAGWGEYVAPESWDTACDENQYFSMYWNGGSEKVPTGGYLAIEDSEGAITLYNVTFDVTLAK